MSSVGCVLVPPDTVNCKLSFVTPLTFSENTRLKVMGAAHVQVLDGGLPKWKSEGRPVEAGIPPPPSPARFTPDFDAGAVAGLDDVRAALAEGIQVADARGPARFAGQAAEPRPGVRAGHMPGAINLPYAALIDGDGAVLDDPDWPILSAQPQLLPARVHASARVADSLVSAGAEVFGTVEHSVIGPNTVIEAGGAIRASGVTVLVVLHKVREVLELDERSYEPRGGTPLLDATGVLIQRADREATERKTRIDTAQVVQRSADDGDLRR
mgnify:CR=1 FL=1